MRSFFISLFCLLLIVATWTTYSAYSDKKIHEFIGTIEEDILIDIEDGNWEQAQNKFDDLENNWHNYKKSACFFFSTDKLNETDYSVARAKYFIKCKDDSNASGELSCLKEQLKFLHENESISLANLL